MNIKEQIKTFKISLVKLILMEASLFKGVFFFCKAHLKIIKSGFKVETQNADIDKANLTYLYITM